jgi:replicative DNA helicase
MSIDDTTELMTLKILAIKSGLSTSAIKRYSELSSEEKDRVNDAWRWMHNNSDRFILADATAGNTIDTLDSHVDWFIKNYNTPKKLFLLDNFHKLRFPSTGRTKKTETVSDGSERIKEITQLNNLHIMATVELRKLDGSNVRPQLADLKDSVQLEYDADIIALVHNDKQVNESTQLVWTGTANGVERSMPYIEMFIWKNKITGQLRQIAYRLNDYNLQIEEVPASEIVALKAKKTNGSNQIRGAREF